MLNSLCQTGTMESATFIKVWQDGLPEKWRNYASLNLVEVSKLLLLSIAPHPPRTF